MSERGGEEMKSQLSLIVICSAALILGNSLIKLKDTHARYQSFDVMREEIEQTDFTVEQFETKLDTIKTKVGNRKSDKVLLRESIINIIHGFSNTPEGVDVNGISFVQQIENAETDGQSGINYIDAKINFRYNDYLTLIGVLLDWVAYSNIPLTIESMEITNGKADIDIKIYGVKE